MIYETSKIQLNPLTMDDFQLDNYGYKTKHKKWLLDPQINKYNSHGIYAVTQKMEEEFISNANNQYTITWAIHDKINTHDDSSYIGNIALQEIDYINRSAELAILIGERTIWGKGYGFHSCYLVLNHAFYKLHLHRIWLGTVEYNKGMKKLAEKLGMKLEGKFNGAFWYNDCYIDILRYAILEAEFQGNYNAISL